MKMSNKKELPRPTGNNILVRPLEVEMKTKSGIILTEQSKTKLVEGEVMKLGHKEYKFDCKPGEIAMYPLSAGYPVEIFGVKYLLMKENQVVLFKSK
tara:strand:- start:303 stop:593 length:291 start_codon:yes stop_codon:yes gene_type:complete